MAKEVSEDVISVIETLRMWQEHLQCAICLETLRDPKSTRCGHTFCMLCIDKVAKGKNAVCPLCNARVARRSILENKKVGSIVQTFHVLLASAKRDIAEMGYDNVVSWSKKPSSKEAMSPPGQTNQVVKPPISKSSRVESWLMEVVPASSSQESSPSVHEDNSPNEDSGSEMVSVSQINPDDGSFEIPQASISKPLSACIEEDGDVEVTKATTKTAKLESKTKSLRTTKCGLSRTKLKDPLKTFCSRANQTFEASYSSNSEVCEVSVPDPVVVVLHGEKENNTNPLPSRSPGWSRVKKMKKDFHQSSKTIRSASKTNYSPLPTIEHAGSGDEQPCLSLPSCSPVLKQKAKIDEIIINLESEIANTEKYAQSKEIIVSSPEKPITLENNPIRLLSVDVSEPSYKPVVCFLKLGSVVARKTPSVPIYLKGSLEHLDCIDTTPMSHRTYSHAQTQTSPQILQKASLDRSTSNCDSSKQLHESLSKTPPTKRSLDTHSNNDIDMMDAETVLFTQPCNHDVKTGGNPILSVAKTTDLNEKDLMETEIIEVPSTMHQESEESQKSMSVIYSQNIQDIPQENLRNAVANSRKVCMEPESVLYSQRSESIIYSQNDGRNQNRTPVLESPSQSVPPLDLELDSSSSSIVDEKKSRKFRALNSSSDSSDSEIGISRKQSEKRKRKKFQVLSENEDSCHNDLNISAVDTKRILANIEAQLEETDRAQSPDWLVAARRKVNEHSPTACNTSRTEIEIDSDGDSELINPTPQECNSNHTRIVTQSDDIVPSSQPPALDPKCLFQSPSEEPVTRNDTGSSSYKQLTSSNTEQSSHDGNKERQHDTVSDAFFTASQTEISETETLNKPINASDKPESSCTSTSSGVKLVFVCSSITAKLASQVEQLANIVGADFSAKYTADTTHLIVKVDESNKADKTLKYLCAVAAGKWVVSFSWVQQSLEAKKLVPEEPFEALDTTGEPGPRRSRESRLAQRKLFSGFQFCCIGEYQDLSRNQLEELLIESGASVVSKPSDFSFHTGTVSITLSQWDESKEQEYSSWLEKHSTPLVQHEWVLDCIGRHSVTSFFNMLICEVSEDVLTAMGIPAYLFEYEESE